MVDAISGAMSTMNVGIQGPRLDPSLKHHIPQQHEWIMLVSEQSSTLWCPGISAPVQMFDAGSKFQPLASAGGLIFGCDKLGKRFLVGNPIAGVWKCIPSPTSYEEEDVEGEEDEEEMCDEYDVEQKIFEYKMLAEEKTGNYWIIGIAGHGEWNSWEDINLLYEYSSKSGMWREVDMLNYGEGYDCKVSEYTGSLPEDLQDNIVLFTSGLYNPKRHLLQEIANQEDREVYEVWGGAVIFGEENNKQVIVGSNLENSEVILWSVNQTKPNETQRVKYNEITRYNGSKLDQWPQYNGGTRYISVINTQLSKQDGSNLTVAVYDIKERVWHELEVPYSGDGWPSIIHFVPRLTLLP